MNWTDIVPARLPEWMSGQQEEHRDPPFPYRLGSPRYLAVRGGLRAQFGEQVRWTDGGLSIGLDGFVRRDGAILESALSLATADGRTFRRSQLRNIGEIPARLPSAVHEEYELFVDGVGPAGPGGRVTYYRRARRIEIAVHSRRAPLASVWRDPEQITQEALAQLGGRLADGESMRAAFGYYEAASSRQQELLRPVFVVLVERLRADDQPRWRFVSVHPATDIDGFPPAAGIEPTIGPV